MGAAGTPGRVFGCVVPLAAALSLALTLLEHLVHPKGDREDRAPQQRGHPGAAAALFIPGPTRQLRCSPGGFATRPFLTPQPDVTLPAQLYGELSPGQTQPCAGSSPPMSPGFGFSRKPLGRSLVAARFPLPPITVSPLLPDLLLCGQPTACEMAFPRDVGDPGLHAPHIPILSMGEPQNWRLRVTWGCVSPPRAVVPACPGSPGESCLGSCCSPGDQITKKWVFWAIKSPVTRADLPVSPRPWGVPC